MSKDSTKIKILEAVGRLLLSKGFQGIGINAVAREAGVDKVLIYRYFENFPTLLKTFVLREEYWPTVEQLVGFDIDKIPGQDPTNLLINLFTNLLRELRKRPTTQAIMCWQLFQRNELTDTIADTNKEWGMKLISLMPEELLDVPDVDATAALSLIHAGISFLILRSKTTQFYGGVDIKSEEGWKRLENGIQTLVKAFVAYCVSQKETGQ